jgi:DNA-binding NarL/FixJ family response regulator
MGPVIDDAPVADSALSSREREVLTGLARGERGAELAERLHIAPDTVRRHVANARQKLGARTRVHAVALALHRGQIRPPLDD